ncbi:HAD-IA family hydrolase [Kitasatospora saccharophila]|uniref:HAD-IA family hydrolase n=1 Tax=Kitasatospora saccharophila TaxID=407973 RepID=A0ABN2WDU7_9ACTN
MNRTGLVLDFGGVLTTPLPRAVRAFEQREGLPEGACLTAMYLDEDSRRLTHDLELGRLTQTEWNRLIAPALGVPPDDLMRRMFADLRPERRMIDAAARARAAGVKVGILSNSGGLDPWNLYADYQLDSRYDAVVLSERHALRKPDPAIYRVVLELLELPGSACVFVDDTAGYLPAAEELGMATVHAGDPVGTIARLEALLGVPLAADR